MFEVLHRRPVFVAIVSILFFVTIFNIFWYREDFGALAQQFGRGNNSDLIKWQNWAQHYETLFNMLAPGERVGIQIQGEHSSGYVVERMATGVVARQSLFLRRERPGVVLTFQPALADKFLSTVPGTDSGEIWQMMKDGLYGRQITVWNDPDIDRLYRGGYLAFMRAIDTRPASLDWPAIKTKLGEH